MTSILPLLSSPPKMPAKIFSETALPTTPKNLTLAQQKTKTGNTLDLRISTTLVANNLSQRESQSTIVKSLQRLIGVENITGVIFGHKTKHENDRQAGWCHIQCLNAAVYTEWLNKSTYILGRRVDFVPHKDSIDGSAPNPTAIRLTHAPVREVIAQKAQAMSNTAAASPLVSEKLFPKALKDLADTMDIKLNTITTNINQNTDKRIETSTDTLKSHAANIYNIMNAMAMKFQQSNQRIHNIMHTVATTLPDPPPPQAPAGRLPQHTITHTEDTNMPLAPPGFNPGQYTNSPSSYHKDPKFPNV